MSVNCPDPNCTTCKLTARLLEVMRDSEDCAESLVAIGNVTAHVIFADTQAEYDGSVLRLSQINRIAAHGLEVLARRKSQ